VPLWSIVSSADPHPTPPRLQLTVLWALRLCVDSLFDSQKSDSPTANPNPIPIHNPSVGLYMTFKLSNLRTIEQSPALNMSL